MKSGVEKMLEGLLSRVVAASRVRQYQHHKRCTECRAEWTVVVTPVHRDPWRLEVDPVEQWTVYMACAEHRRDRPGA